MTLIKFSDRPGFWGGPADRVPAALQAAGDVWGAEVPGFHPGLGSRGLAGRRSRVGPIASAQRAGGVQPRVKPWGSVAPTPLHPEGVRPPPKSVTVSSFRQITVMEADPWDSALVPAWPRDTA